MSQVVGDWMMLELAESDALGLPRPEYIGGQNSISKAIAQPVQIGIPFEPLVAYEVRVFERHLIQFASGTRAWRWCEKLPEGQN